MLRNFAHQIVSQVLCRFRKHDEQVGVRWEHVAHDFETLQHIRVHNLGALSHRDTLAHLAAADLLLFPSVFEPLGLVLLEAMSAGCCILASDAAGPSDVLQTPWGLTMNFRDPTTRVDAITQGIQSFLSWDRGRIRSYAALARRSADQFSWRQCASVHSKALMDTRSERLYQPHQGGQLPNPGDHHE